MEKYSRFNREQLLYIALNMIVFGYLVFTKQYYPAAIMLAALIGVFLLLNKLHLFSKRSWDKFTNDSIKKLKPSVVEAATESIFIVAFTRDGMISWYNKSSVKYPAGTPQ